MTTWKSLIDSSALDCRYQPFIFMAKARYQNGIITSTLLFLTMTLQFADLNSIIIMTMLIVFQCFV